MGDRVEKTSFSRKDRYDFRAKVQRCLDALGKMLADDSFDISEPQLGMEIELNLVDDDFSPSSANDEVLRAIEDPDFQTELGRFNIEFNIEPRPIAGDCFLELEKELRADLNGANAKAQSVGSNIAMIGILPTLSKENFSGKWISKAHRYSMLNEQIIESRGEDIELKIRGLSLPGSTQVETLETCYETILPEAACTSVQLHLQVAPVDFARFWNAAQVLCSVQVAIAANSPFFADRALWHETRIPLFQQATDTRPPEYRNQGVRPRVWFGERWITSIFDLFEENSRFFPALLPECREEDPLAVLEAGGIPTLAELKMHNGTVYRWNRPIYDTIDGVQHLRLENRVLPAAPTIADTVANAAFYYGAVRALADADRPVWSAMSFDAARENLDSAALRGFDSRLYWPHIGSVTPQELVIRRLLPMAYSGLETLGVRSETASKYLGIIEQRCQAQQSGSVWQRYAVSARERAGDSRVQALTGMFSDYLDRMHSGEPVHTWDYS